MSPELTDILARHGFGPPDQARVADLMNLLPREGTSVLDAGAHTGYCAEYLTASFEQVVAIDLDKPTWECPGVTTLEGDITQLKFADGSFDCILCAEVLEHIPDLDKAARELARVCRRWLLIGVPFDQDLRMGRTTCANCGYVNPPYGHVNSFTEARLKRLFSMLEPAKVSYIWPMPPLRTNPVSAWLRDRAGNLYGTYDQYQTCIRCGKPLGERPAGAAAARAITYFADALDRIQNSTRAPKPGWLHILFRKN